MSGSSASIRSPLARTRAPTCPCSISPDGSMMLLGLPVLNAIGKFTIDADSRQLIFG